MKPGFLYVIVFDVDIGFVKAGSVWRRCGGGSPTAPKEISGIPKPFSHHTDDETSSPSIA